MSLCMPEMAFIEVCCLAMLSAAAGREGSGLSTGDGPAESGRVLEILREAAGMGFRNVPMYRSETALAPLRDRDDFRLLLTDLAMPADPFAPGP